MKEVVKVYTDGSFNDKTRVYGSGVVYDIEDKRYEYTFGGSDPMLAKSYNVTGEIMAVMYAVKRAIRDGYISMEIYYDKTGIEEWPKGKWAAKSLVSRKYAEFMIKAAQVMDIKYFKIKSHSGDKYNDRADELAKMGAGIL